MICVCVAVHTDVVVPVDLNPCSFPSSRPGVLEANASCPQDRPALSTARAQCYHWTCLQGAGQSRYALEKPHAEVRLVQRAASLEACCMGVAAHTFHLACHSGNPQGVEVT